jgi:ubiquitin
MSKRVPTTTSIAITITNHCIKIGDTVSASIENGLVVNIVGYFLY